jgi:DNA repair protein RecO (recombination protein O)
LTDRPARRGSDNRVEHEPAYLLHTYSWRETSLIIEVFTRNHGRVALVAKGAKRPTSHFRGVLTAFCPLLLAWSGRADIRTLVRAEWCGGLSPLRGQALLAGFYLNELLVRLLARGDAHESLFAGYGQALADLACGVVSVASALRRFEVTLLREAGFLPALDRCADGAAIDPGAYYRIEAYRELARVEHPGDDLCIRGSTALAMSNGQFGDPGVAAESKAALRQLIRYHLDGRPLNTRRILQDLRDL